MNVDICLFSGLTEFTSSPESPQFLNSARYERGILREIDYPLREPNTGIMLLAAILEQEGYSVEILDATLLRDPQGYLAKNATRYRLVGFTSLTNNFDTVIEFIKIVKHAHPGIYCVVGGPHVSFLPEKILQQVPEVDVVCIGEAEQSFPWTARQLLRRPLQDFIYEGISAEISETANPTTGPSHFSWHTKDVPQGIAIRTGEYDQPFINSGFPPSTELAGLPLPARHLISRVYQVADVIVNRGCPNECSFCSRTHLFPEMRIRPLSQVLEEVDYILSCGNYRFINFYDNINVKKSYFEDFLGELTQRGNMLPWGAELRSDGITPHQASLLKAAKCRVVATGIESASEKVLTANFKYQNLKEVRKGIEALKGAGIAVQAYFVIGLPGDDPTEFEKTLDYLRSLPLQAGVDKVDFFVATPYPGSDLAFRPEVYEIKVLHKPFATYNCRDIQFETPTLEISEIQQMITQADALKAELGLK